MIAGYRAATKLQQIRHTTNDCAQSAQKTYAKTNHEMGVPDLMGVIHTVLIEDGKVVRTIVNLNQEQMTILKLLGPDCEKYHGLQG